MTHRDDILAWMQDNPGWYTVMDLVAQFDGQTDKGINAKLRSLYRFGAVEVDRCRGVDGRPMPWLWRAVIE